MTDPTRNDERAALVWVVYDMTDRDHRRREGYGVSPEPKFGPMTAAHAQEMVRSNPQAFYARRVS